MSKNKRKKDNTPERVVRKESGIDSDKLFKMVSNEKNISNGSQS